MAMDKTIIHLHYSMIQNPFFTLLCLPFIKLFQ